MVDSRTPAIESVDPTSLRRGLAGQVLLPGDGNYNTRRRVWNAMVDRRPAVIARCVNPSDVATAIRFAREQRLEMGVRCGGHSILGQCVPDGGLMIDLTPMSAVRVDPARRRAWIQGGAPLVALDRATQAYGLATTAGNVSHTGVGGLTLGGGMGWLARRLGLACDNVTGFEVVTADAEVLRVSESQNADLFWGLRGGGGNFGVVTEFEFRVHDVGTAAQEVNLFYRPEDAPDALRRWRDLIPDAPREATLTAWAGTAGEWSSLPATLHHQPVVNVGYVWVGDADEGSRFLGRLQGTAVPAARHIETMSYLQLQTSQDDEQGYGHLRRYWKGHYLRAFDDDAIAAFIGRGSAAGAGVDGGQLPSGSLQSYGGAIGDVGKDETAFDQRDAFVEFIASAAWSEPGEDEAHIDAARRYAADLEPHASGAYVNVLADEGQAGVQRAYRGDKLARLGELKHRYDPDNVFHLNHNIRPQPPA